MCEKCTKAFEADKKVMSELIDAMHFMVSMTMAMHDRKLHMTLGPDGPNRVRELLHTWLDAASADSNQDTGVLALRLLQQHAEWASRQLAAIPTTKGVN